MDLGPLIACSERHDAESGLTGLSHRHRLPGPPCASVLDIAEFGHDTVAVRVGVRVLRVITAGLRADPWI